MTRWKYHILLIDVDSSTNLHGRFRTFIGNLQELGNDGWEAVSIASPNQGADLPGFVLMKREEPN